MSTRYDITAPKSGDPIKADLIAALVEAARGTGIPSNRGEYESAGEMVNRLTSKHVEQWFEADTSTATADPFSVFEVYGAGGRADGKIVLFVRAWTGTPGQLMAVNERYPISPTARGHVKIIGRAPVLTRIAGTIGALGTVGPDTDEPYKMTSQGEGYYYLCMAPQFGADVAYVLEKPTSAALPTGGVDLSDCECSDLRNFGPLVRDPSICCQGAPLWVLQFYSLGSPFAISSTICHQSGATYTNDSIDGVFDGHWLEISCCEEEPTTTPATTPTGSTTGATTTGATTTGATTTGATTTAAGGCVATYRVRMTISETLSVIELEPIDTAECPVVCARYERRGVFRCKGNNLFGLVKGQNLPNQWPQCICVRPGGSDLPDGGQVEICDVLAPSHFGIDAQDLDGIACYGNGTTAAPVPPNVFEWDNDGGVWAHTKGLQDLPLVVYDFGTSGPWERADYKTVLQDDSAAVRRNSSCDASNIPSGFIEATGEWVIQVWCKPDGVGTKELYIEAFPPFSRILIDSPFPLVGLSYDTSLSGVPASQVPCVLGQPIRLNRVDYPTYVLSPCSTLDFFTLNKCWQCALAPSVDSFLDAADRLFLPSFITVQGYGGDTSVDDCPYPPLELLTGKTPRNTGHCVKCGESTPTTTGTSTTGTTTPTTTPGTTVPTTTPGTTVPTTTAATTTTPMTTAATTTAPATTGAGTTSTVATGACCRTTSSNTPCTDDPDCYCEMRDHAACNAVGGFYVGAGIPCESVVCTCNTHNDRCHI